MKYRVTESGTYWRDWLVEADTQEEAEELVRAGGGSLESERSEVEVCAAEEV